ELVGGREQVQVFLRVAEDKIEAGFDGESEVRALDALADSPWHAEGEVRQPDGQVHAFEVRVGADHPYRVEAHFHEAVRIRADGREAGVDDDLVIGALRLRSKQLDELLR